MITSYLKLAWRNLIKHKVIALINILGLSTGIAACILIYLYVQHELNFDKYNSKQEKIVRVTSKLTAPSSVLDFATSPIPLASTVMREIPEVKSAVYLDQVPGEIQKDNDVFNEDGFFAARKEIFKIFDLEFIEGNPEEALEHPHSIVLTESVAKKYFGKENAFGKTLRNAGKDIKVTGIIKDRPSNSDLEITALVSFDGPELTDWVVFDGYTYVLLNNASDIKSFNKKVNDLGKTVVQSALDKIGATAYHISFFTEPLADVHFSKGKLGDVAKGNKQSVYIFSVLAAFILFIALLNYINLSTARSVDRAKEVGVRKVVGALHGQLIRQFMFESSLLIFIAGILAVAMVSIGLPVLSKLIDAKIAFNFIDLGLFIIASMIITFILAGIYPAFVLSGFKPITVLKGRFRQSAKGNLLRKGVTIFQFATAAALIFGTTVIYMQMEFIKNTDLGYNSEQLVSITTPSDSVYQPGITNFKLALKEKFSPEKITIGSAINEFGITMASTTVKNEGDTKEMMFNYFAVDTNYMNVFGIKLAEGRNFSDAFGTDKQNAFIVNEAFVKSMGWKTGIGKNIEGWDQKGKIIGVVKDFYFRSMHTAVEPLVMVYRNFPGNSVTLKLKPSQVAEVKSIYQQFVPAKTFDYNFYDELLKKQYKKDRLTLKLFYGFTGLAVLICALGLYGLITLTTIHRTREIGIRKVMGANPLQLVGILVSGLTKLLVVACVAGLVIAALLLNKWLENYAYHTTLRWWMFAIPVLFLVLITMMVTGRNVFKAAMMNPVKSLKTD